MSYDFDVVVLSLGREKYTIGAIESILNQKEVTFHIWIIDQGSEQSEIKNLENFVQDKNTISLIKLANNLGVAGGRNYGMRLGKGTFIISIDNDALIEDRLLFSNVKKVFQNDEDLGIIGFKINNFFTRELDYTSWAYSKNQLSDHNQSFPTTRYVGAGHAIRRSAINNTNLYDEKLFFYWEELDLSYQIINNGHRIEYHPEFVVYHKISPDKRLAWKTGRYYFLVRNAIYLDWKYFRKTYRIAALALGYFVKGMINKLPIEALRGIKDSFYLMRTIEAEIKPLNKLAKEYVNKYDTKMRGNIITRLLNEVIAKL